MIIAQIPNDDDCVDQLFDEKEYESLKVEIEMNAEEPVVILSDNRVLISMYVPNAGWRTYH